MTDSAIPADAAGVKQCCASVYGSQAARYLLGDSFHPGGLALTEELATSMAIGPGSWVLDVAAGKGTSALFLAEKFGCRVTGIDLSEQNVLDAGKQASKQGLSRLVDFRVADAEALPFQSAIFDAILCECAFCTFPSKKTAASEFARVLKPGGRAGISDITKDGSSLPDLEGLLAWISCIGDAQPLESYGRWLSEAGLRLMKAAHRSQCLQEMVHGIRSKLLMAEIMMGLKKLDLPGLDLTQAKAFSKAAQDAIASHHLGYGIVVAEKPSDEQTL